MFTDRNGHDAADPREAIRSYVGGHFKRRQLRDDEDIFALGFVTSLFAMQLVMFIEQHFDIAVPPEDLEMENFRSIDALAALVERKRRERSGTTADALTER